MQDFTLITYKKLLQTLLIKGYSFQTLQDFIRQPEDKTVILRHDVDQAYRSQRSEVRGQRADGNTAGWMINTGWSDEWMNETRDE